MIEENRIKQKITDDNFLRFKFISLIFLGFSLFTFLMYFLEVDYWAGEHKDIYLVLDYSFVVIAVCSFFFFWFYKKENRHVKNSFVILITFLILNWSAIITGVELTSLGFSTYMIAIVATAFFIYLNIIVSALLYLSSFAVFLSTLYFFNHLDQTAYPFLISFFPIVIVSYLISRKNFKNKIRTLEQEKELRLLTKKLQHAKNHLEEEVKIRTTKLAQSEAKFRNYVENAHDLIYQLSSEGIFTYVSPNWKDYLGHNIDEVLGQKVEFFLHPNDVLRYYEFLNGVLITAQNKTGIEYRVRHKNGTWRWHFSNGSQLKKPNDNITTYLGIASDITEKKKKQDQLEDNMERYQKLFDNMPNGVAVYKPVKDANDFKFIDVNKEAEQITNTSKDELIGSTLLEKFPNMKDGPLFKGLQKVHKHGKELHLPPFYYEDSIRKGWRENQIYKLSTGEIVAIFKDITQQKEAEQALMHSRDLMQYIIEHNRSAVAIHDKNFRYIYVSQSYINQFNVKEKNIIGKHHYEVFPDLPQKWRDVHIKALNGIVSSADDDPYYLKDGTIEWTRWECRPWYEADGAIGGFIVYTEIITDRKNMELEIIQAKEEAEENELKFSTAFYTSPDALTLTSFKGEYIDVNDGYTKLSGYSRDEVVGKLSSDINIWVNPQERDKMLDTLKEEGFVENMEVAFCKKDGSIVSCLVSAKIIKIKNESVILLLAKDISEIKKIQNELIKSKESAEQANRLKTEFLHNMSHEVRTPLNGIMGFSEIIEMPGLSEEKRKNYLRIIRSSSQQLLRIIDDILEISNLETKQLELREGNFCLNELLIELHSGAMAKAKEQGISLHLKMELSKDQSFIQSDKYKLTKILSNLVENALRFTHEGSVEIGYYLDKTNLVLYVKDTGIGISPESQEIIFERFSQEDKNLSRKYGGLGLGLSISKENAELLGGTITLESEKGKGATFFITIPYKPVQDSSADKNRSLANLPEEKTPVILIVEDEITNYLYLEALFEEEPHVSYKLLHAKNGQEAIDICAETPDLDLVLMDIKMPGMDGYEATKKIKAERPGIPIIAQTAYSDNENQEKALKAGCDDTITKPIEMAGFFELIAKYIAKD